MPNLEITMKITTEELFVLYRDLRRLFPKTTIEDFSDIIEEEGYWDTKTRINIQKESLENLKTMWFEKGIPQVKKLWQLFTTNRINQIVDNDLITLSKIHKDK
tara:strand:- start:9124 stop:9432 length:309 start_codon:yes stop_codon:yes gene_type:complete